MQVGNAGNPDILDIRADSRVQSVFVSMVQLPPVHPRPHPSLPHTCILSICLGCFLPKPELLV